MRARVGVGSTLSPSKDTETARAAPVFLEGWPLHGRKTQEGSGPSGIDSGHVRALTPSLRFPGLLPRISPPDARWGWVRCGMWSKNFHLAEGTRAESVDMAGVQDLEAARGYRTG